MNAVLFITVVTVALLSAYSSQVRSSDRRREAEHGAEARGYIWETEWTQGKLEASVQFKNKKPKFDFTEPVTEQGCLKTVESNPPKKTVHLILLEPKEQHRIRGHGWIRVNETAEVDYIARYRTQISGC
ncbi:unnamed protein product [Dicrocoelium dendriticum]|nr:unnamed protein product [Dicrocoelium dendriticum]